MNIICRELETEAFLEELRPTKKYTKSDWAGPDVPFPHISGEVDSVVSLFERAHFWRAWIRQETILAKNAIVGCGSIENTQEEFRIASICIRSKVCSPGPLESIDGLASSRRERMCTIFIV